MHIAPFDNENQPIVNVDNERVPLNYFNIVKLSLGEEYFYQLVDFESCVVPATGRVSVAVDGTQIAEVGLRTEDVWDGEPEAIYVPTGMTCKIRCLSKTAEVFVAGAKYNETLTPFAVHADDIDMVQYGSDDTKTHRKIKHILGQKQHGQVGRLLVSELFTVGAGGWSGFPSHKHSEDRDGETRHDETYNFRFKPANGGALQLLQRIRLRARRGLPCRRRIDLSHRRRLSSVLCFSRMRDVLFYDFRRRNHAWLDPIFSASLCGPVGDYSRNEGDVE